MKADVLLGIILGAAVGATVVTLYKPAQNAVKKGTEMIKSEAENMIKKTKDPHHQRVVNNSD